MKNAFILSMDLSNNGLTYWGGGGGDIDIYVVHYILCTTVFSGIRAGLFLVHCTVGRVYIRFTLCNRTEYT